MSYTSLFKEITLIVYVCLLHCFSALLKQVNTEIKREKERGNFFGNSRKVGSNLNGWY
jgi:hypothetical protein